MKGQSCIKSLHKNMNDLKKDIPYNGLPMILPICWTTIALI